MSTNGKRTTLSDSLSTIIAKAQEVEEENALLRERIVAQDAELKRARAVMAQLDKMLGALAQFRDGAATEPAQATATTRKVATLDEETRAAWVQMRQNGASINQICMQYHAGAETVKKVLREAGAMGGSTCAECGQPAPQGETLCEACDREAVARAAAARRASAAGYGVAAS